MSTVSFAVVFAVVLSCGTLLKSGIVGVGQINRTDTVCLLCVADTSGMSINNVDVSVCTEHVCGSVVAECTIKTELWFKTCWYLQIHTHTF